VQNAACGQSTLIGRPQLHLTYLRVC